MEGTLKKRHGIKGREERERRSEEDGW